MRKLLAGVLITASLFTVTATVSAETTRGIYPSTYYEAMNKVSLVENIRTLRMEIVLLKVEEMENNRARGLLTTRAMYLSEDVSRKCTTMIKERETEINFCLHLLKERR